MCFYEENTMHWEELTSDQFPQAVETARGVCLVPLSVIERHGHHLPMGTDMFIGRELCQRAAALEPALIFPDFYLTQILEARHCPGTIALDADLLVRLLDHVCREIARNGLHKIVLVSAHGGNYHLARFFAQAQLASPRDYVVYVTTPALDAEDEAALKAAWETTVDGHAGERETSAILAIRPDLVHKDQLHADGEGMPLDRLKALSETGVYTGIWWYGDHPTHYRGDGSPATVEKGELFLSAYARALARAIRAIKADEVAKQLQDEFFAASEQPTPSDKPSLPG
jgi:creatinine amidohydrolase